MAAWVLILLSMSYLVIPVHTVEFIDSFQLKGVTCFMFEAVIVDVPITKEKADAYIKEKLGNDAVSEAIDSPTITLAMGRLTDSCLMRILPEPSHGIGKSYKTLYAHLHGVINKEEPFISYEMEVRRFYQKRMTYFDPLLNNGDPFLVNHINFGSKMFSMRTGDITFRANYVIPTPKNCKMPEVPSPSHINYLVYGSPVQLQICEFLDEYCKMRGECNEEFNFCHRLKKPELVKALAASNDNTCADITLGTQQPVCEVDVNIDILSNDMKSSILLENFDLGQSGAKLTGIYVKTTNLIDLIWPCV